MIRRLSDDRYMTLRSSIYCGQSGERSVVNSFKSGAKRTVPLGPPSRVALGTLTISDAAGNFTVVCTGVTLQKVPDRVFDRTATNQVYTLLATTITEQ